MPARLLAVTRQARMVALMEFFIELMIEKRSQFPRVRMCEGNFRRRNRFSEDSSMRVLFGSAMITSFIIAVSGLFRLICWWLRAK